MNVQTLFQTVSFQDVEKELLISNPQFKNKMEAFESYFNELRSAKLSSEQERSKIQVSREYFDYSYLTDATTNEWINTFDTFVSAEHILASEVANKDVEDLSKSLIVSLVLTLLTNEGTVFTEEARKAKCESFQPVVEEVLA